MAPIIHLGGGLPPLTGFPTDEQAPDLSQRKAGRKHFSISIYENREPPGLIKSQAELSARDGSRHPSNASIPGMS